MADDEAKMRQAYKQKMEQADVPIEKLRYACLARGVNGIKALGRTFRIYDDDGSKSLNFEELKEGLQDYGVPLDDQMVKDLFKHFDKDGSGSISFDEFLFALRGPMSESRIAIIGKAFQKVDKTGDGVFTVEDLRNVYDVRNHPKYKSGEWTPDQCLRSFLDSFDAPNDKDGKVTKEDFMNYYAGVSASIDNDAYFDLMIRNAWKL